MAASSSASRAVALFERNIEARIEAQLEQLHDLGGDLLVLDQRVRHVALRIGHADLPQEARERAHQRHVAPHQPGRQHERVVAVVLGAAAHDDQEGAFELLLDGVEIERAAAGALDRHVVEPDVGLLGGADRDLVGLLVDDAKAHVLEHGHALRQRDRPIEAPHFEPDAVALLPLRRWKSALRGWASVSFSITRMSWTATCGE